MEGSWQKDDYFYKRVLNRSHKFLIDYLDPNAVLDFFLSEEYLDRTQVRDIKDLQITSDRTRAIVEKVKSKGVKGYKDFRRILRKAGQKRIADHLQEQERKLIDKSKATVPFRQQTAQEKVIYRRTGQSDDKRNEQSDVPLEVSKVDDHSLETKQREKSYRPPKNCCLYDGRLLKLAETDIDILEKKCTFQIGEGGFGKVFTSEADLEGFGMRIAKKVQKHSDTSCARREKNASRIMHPFILPLLAVVDKPKGKDEVWFVSPFMEKGDLQKVIEEDRNASDPSKIQMNCIMRIRILLQIALAIEYIHTEVLNVRGVILHKDISSRNIVLDSSFNARLIDFGLAREKNDQTTAVAGKLCYLPPEIGTGVSADESWDYYAFGVVIREMLTGLAPEIDGTTFLRSLTEENVHKALQANVWPSHITEIGEKAAALNSIAGTCLQRDESKSWTATNFKTNVVDKLYKIWESNELYALPKDHSRCHMCIINPQASKSSLNDHHAGTCTQKIKACISCEKNSFLNPIRCYCRTDLKPSIGYKWGALLVAGNDTDLSLAKALTKDLKEFKNLITSKAPLIMGISEENVRIIVPDKPGEKGDELSSKVKKELQYFESRSDIDTLLIYFSCHGKEGNGSEGEDCKNSFDLGFGSDTITQGEFEKQLDNLKNKTKLIVILDRCFPLHINGSDQIVQINACKKNQKADFNKDGSTFTKYLIQGLKARSGEKCSGDCKSCEKYWEEPGDFVTVQSLFEYVRSHMEKKNKELIPDMQQIDGWNCIAYYTDEVVEIDFTSEHDKRHILVPLKYLQNMRQLEKKIFEMFGEDDKKKTVKIKKDTFRKEGRFEDCDTLEKVISAWTQRWPLTVVFERKTTENSHSGTSAPP